VLELDGLVKRFGSTVALDGLSFDVHRGQMFGFVGTNGAGKTTAMRIVLGVLEADGGAVRWEDRPVDSAVRARIGYMPEERGLYPKMRVRDHLVYLARLHGAPEPAARSAADRWMTELGVAARADDRVEALSLGNQQRVQLAAALVHEPDVLVLDEPFSGLDPVGVDVLAGVLRGRVREGAAVVFSSHQLELVERLCDAVGIIRAGRLVATGTVDELRRAGQRRRRLRVQVDGAGPGWAQGIPGTRVVSVDDGSPRPTPTADGSAHEPAGGAPDGAWDGAVAGTLIELDDGADDQAVLDAARAHGRVVAFSPVEPTLTDLFREAVAS
jgi:ABC-2 type transport system ATP-binding protein